MLLLVLVQIGVSIITQIPMRSSQLMAFELFITDFRQKKKSCRLTTKLPHTAWKPFLRYINTTKRDWKWCSSSGGSQYSKRINSFIGSSCGGSAICGHTVWGFRERQDCWSLWHIQQTTTSLSGYLNILKFSLLVTWCYSISSETSCFQNPVGFTSRFFFFPADTEQHGHLY